MTILGFKMVFGKDKVRMVFGKGQGQGLDFKGMMLLNTLTEETLGIDVDHC